MTYTFRLLMFFLLLPFSSGLLIAQEEVVRFSGFRSFAWGTTVEAVKQSASGTFERQFAINPDEFNRSPLSAFTGFKMGPEPLCLRFSDEFSEVVDYFFVQNELCMVIQTPNMYDMFRPGRVLKEMDAKYPDPKWRNSSTALPFPPEFGLPDPFHLSDKTRRKYERKATDALTETLTSKTDLPVTITWENETGRIRTAITAMAPMELQKVERIVHLSKEHSLNALELLAAWKKEQAAKEEEERKAREAAAAAAEAGQ